MSNGINLKAGTASLPAYSFVDDKDTGLYRSAANTLNATCGGTEVLELTATSGLVPVNMRWDANSADSVHFVATRTFKVVAITARVETAGTDASAVTAVVKKAASATAIASGTALHTGSINLKGTAATNQSLTLSSTSSDLEIAAGTAIGIDFTGTLTAATGCVTVTLAPV